MSELVYGYAALSGVEDEDAMNEDKLRQPSEQGKWTKGELEARPVGGRQNRAGVHRQGPAGVRRQDGGAVNERTRLTTTLNRLKSAGACTGRYKHLVRALGGVSFNHDEPINLLRILEINGVEDCLWALCATAENCDRIARLMAADFAEAVLPVYERDYPNDGRPRAAIAAARAHARGEIAAAAWAAEAKIIRCHLIPDEEERR